MDALDLNDAYQQAKEDVQEVMVETITEFYRDYFTMMLALTAMSQAQGVSNDAEAPMVS